MSNKDGILITNKNIYGLVNPPPKPSSKDGALPHQDISSAAVRWDTFVDLSNSGFSFVPASHTFMALIDKVPYSLLNGTDVWYPLYQNNQITFTQTQTFSKIRLWLKGRKGQLSGAGESLKNELPQKNIIGGANATTNWAGPKIANTNHPNNGGENRDGMCNNAGSRIQPPIAQQKYDSGICEGYKGENTGSPVAQPVDVWDISGPTILGNTTTPPSTYALYENISPNGWNLAWDVFITETAPDGTMRFLQNTGSWTLPSPPGQPPPSGTTGIIFYYNPKAYALVKGSNALSRTLDTKFHVPIPTKEKDTGNIPDITTYWTVRHCDWISSGTSDFHVIHSQETGFMGDHLWYCERKCGYQVNNPTGGPPGGGGPPPGLQAWTDIPIEFKQGHSYLANVTMRNMQQSISQQQNNPAAGPGLVNVNAATYLELIV
jgi:hypothetical protein